MKICETITFHSLQNKHIVVSVIEFNSKYYLNLNSIMFQSRSCKVQVLYICAVKTNYFILKISSIDLTLTPPKWDVFLTVLKTAMVNE